MKGAERWNSWEDGRRRSIFSLILDSSAAIRNIFSILFAYQLHEAPTVFVRGIADSRPCWDMKPLTVTGRVRVGRCCQLVKVMNEWNE